MRGGASDHRLHPRIWGPLAVQDKCPDPGADRQLAYDMGVCMTTAGPSAAGLRLTNKYKCTHLFNMPRHRKIAGLKVKVRAND